MASIKYILPKTGADVSKLVDTAHKGVESGRAKVQIALIGIAYHAFRTGDYTEINRLINKMPQGGVNCGAITKWAQKFLGLSIVDVKESDPETGKERTVTMLKNQLPEGQLKKHIERLFNGDPKSSDPHERAGAKGTMFWAYAPKSEVKAWDINEELRKLLKMRTDKMKRIDEGKVSKEDAAKINTNLDKATIDALIAAVKLEVIDEPANDGQTVLEKMAG